MLLPHGETEERKRYAMPDPDALGPSYGRLYDATWYRHPFGTPLPETIEVSREDLRRLLSLANGYLTLTTYELGQEHCVSKLRDVWRARKARP
jgi:hypothetical protein